MIRKPGKCHEEQCMYDKRPSYKKLITDFFNSDTSNYSIKSEICFIQIE